MSWMALGVKKQTALGTMEWHILTKINITACLHLCLHSNPPNHSKHSIKCAQGHPPPPHTHTHTDQITSLVTQNDTDCHSHSLNLKNKAKKLPVFYPGEKVKYSMKMVELAQHLTFPPKVTLPVMKILLATKAHTLVLYYLWTQNGLHPVQLGPPTHHSHPRSVFIPTTQLHIVGTDNCAGNVGCSPRYHGSMCSHAGQCHRLWCTGLEHCKPSTVCLVLSYTLLSLHGTYSN